MVSKEIQQAIEYIRNQFSNVPFSPKSPTHMIMRTGFYKAMLTHPSTTSLSEEEAEEVIQRLASGEKIELDNGMFDSMNSDGVIVRGFLNVS